MCCSCWLFRRLAVLRNVGHCDYCRCRSWELKRTSTAFPSPRLSIVCADSLGHLNQLHSWGSRRISWGSELWVRHFEICGSSHVLTFSSIVMKRFASDRFNIMLIWAVWGGWRSTIYLASYNTFWTWVFTTSRYLAPAPAACRDLPVLLVLLLATCTFFLQVFVITDAKQL